MENIYLPRYKNITQIDKKFDLYKQNLSYANVLPKTDQELQKAMNFIGSATEFETLLDSVALENLSQTDDIRPSVFDPSAVIARKRSTVEIPKKALKLKTVSALIESQKNYSEFHRRRYLKYNKYKHIKLDIDNTNADIMPLDEIVISVRVYEPFPHRSYASISLKPKLSQEFLVLGSQYLYELRDQIYCQCKFGPFFDISKHPPAKPPSPNSTDAIESDPGFFFIGDTFYNDHRFTSIDYSTVIRDWMERKKIATPKTSDMAQAMFKDLTVRLGYPQVYQHHGNCEHLFTFADIRLISATCDSRVRADYPLLRIISSTRSQFCRLCGLVEASIVVLNSDVHIHDPTYLCQNCFEMFHYVDNVKQGEFEAYRYYGNRPIAQ